MLINFDAAETAKGVFYGGDAGAKEAIVHGGEIWMLKYPKTTRGLTDPQISYTTSPLSEFIGSKIYAMLGIPVHETLLGYKKNKVVVACKDFTRLPLECTPWPSMRLVPFHDIKNSFMSSDVENYSGSGSETLIDEVLATIKGHEIMQTIPQVMERFWDMFVVDAFIGNNDRNNGNWGILIDQNSGRCTLAPVYDNGNAFFNKRGIAQMEKRITDNAAMADDAYLNPLCAYKYTGLDNEGQKINPFTYIKNTCDPDCHAAVARFTGAIDIGRIDVFIAGIPETAGNLSVMPSIQKAFYMELMRLRLAQITSRQPNKEVIP